METVILLTLLLIGILLGGKLLRAGKLCPAPSKQITLEAGIEIKALGTRFLQAVKLAKEESYLLNIITIHNTPKGAQTAPVYTEIHTYRG